MFADADFLRRARERILDAPPGGGAADGDHILNPGFLPPADRALRDAAVLIPVVGDATLSVVLTRRHAGLANHAGQVAFPGGKIDAADGGALACALREAEEEIGLRPSLVTPVGHLPPYVTGTGFRVFPVLGRIEAPFAARPNAGEVDAVFEVPLGFLMDPANHRRGSRTLQGVERHFYEMPFGSHYIWGATAGIIRGLWERVYAC